MATVTFENVNKVYGEFHAVKDLNLEIGDGEFMVLVGPSGCGKTTSLRMIAGLEEITGGTLRIGDRVVNDVPPKDRDIAMVFQSYALYPHMSVRDNLAFGLKLRKVPEGRDRAPGQGDRGDHPARQAARSQAEGAVRRPAPARRARPGDRPRARGLPDGRAALQPRRQAARPDARRDRPLHQRLQTTIVYVTHDQVEAMTMGSRIAVMNEGLLQQVGTPQTLYDTPINRFVAGFIGSPSMNFVEVHMEGSGEAARLVGPADWSIPIPTRYREAADAKGRQDARGRLPTRASRHRRGRIGCRIVPGTGRRGRVPRQRGAPPPATPPTRTSSASSAPSTTSDRATS